MKMSCIHCSLVLGKNVQKNMPSYILSITEFICQSIDKNEFGCGIFIDLKKRIRHCWQFRSSNEIATPWSES